MPFTDSIKMVDVVITPDEDFDTTPSDVIAGKKFIGSTRHIEVGSLPRNPSRSDVTIATGESYNIPYGVNPNSYNVKARELDIETVGTATNDDLISGKTAWVNGEKITGTIVNIGAESEELDAGASHTISKGYHNGGGIIRAKDLGIQTPGDARATDIVEGRTAWVNGVKITGSMQANMAETIEVNAGESYTIPAGYHDGNGMVKGASLSDQTPGNASASEIVAGFSAWVNGNKIDGTIINNPAEQIMLPMNGTYVIPAGYHNGTGSVTQNVPSKAGQTVAPSGETQVLATAGYYMEGDITVTAVENALRYQVNEPDTPLKDSAGDNITEQELQVDSEHTARINIYTDNWHDNSTFNVYKVAFGALVDRTGAVISSLIVDMVFDFDNPNDILVIGNVVITSGIDNNVQYINVTGINSGKITATDLIDARPI